MTVLLAAPLIEGALLGPEPIVSGVECEADVVEGALLDGELMGD